MNASRYHHPHCVQGGFHPDDTIEGLVDAPPIIQQEIQRFVWESLRLYPGVVGFPVVPTKHECVQLYMSIYTKGGLTGATTQRPEATELAAAKEAQ